jgi:hypothetical protein
MRIIIDSEIIEGISYRGVLALVATAVLGDGCWTTAQLAQAVSCNSSLMLEGLQEIYATGLVGKQSKGKWPVGTGVANELQLQILDSAAARRKDFLDDMKSIYEWGNKGLSFTMSAADGSAVQRWLKQNKWDREQWRTALRNRFLSEGIVKSQPVHLWLGRLVEYLEAPLDRYGKVMPNGVGGKTGEAISREQGNRAAREAAVAAAGAKS